MTTQLAMTLPEAPAHGPRPLTDAELANEWRRGWGSWAASGTVPDIDAVRDASERESRRMYRMGWQDGLRAYPDNDPDDLAYGLAFYAKRAAMEHSAYEQGVYDALRARTGATA